MLYYIGVALLAFMLYELVGINNHLKKIMGLLETRLPQRTMANSFDDRFR